MNVRRPSERVTCCLLTEEANTLFPPLDTAFVGMVQNNPCPPTCAIFFDIVLTVLEMSQSTPDQSRRNFVERQNSQLESFACLRLERNGQSSYDKALDALQKAIRKVINSSPTDVSAAERQLSDSSEETINESLITFTDNLRLLESDQQYRAMIQQGSIFGKQCVRYFSRNGEEFRPGPHHGQLERWTTMLRYHTTEGALCIKGHTGACGTPEHPRLALKGPYIRPQGLETRLAAVSAIGQFFICLCRSPLALLEAFRWNDRHGWSVKTLIASLMVTLYELANDDDEDVRSGAAQIISKIISEIGADRALKVVDLSPPAARTAVVACFLDPPKLWGMDPVIENGITMTVLAKTQGDLGKVKRLFFDGQMLLEMLGNEAPTVKLRLKPEIANYNKFRVSATDIFEEEPDNLYMNVVREIESFSNIWMAKPRQIYHSKLQDDMNLIQSQIRQCEHDGPLGVFSDVKNFLLAFSYIRSAMVQVTDLSSTLGRGPSLSVRKDMGLRLRYFIESNGKKDIHPLLQEEAEFVAQLYDHDLTRPYMEDELNTTTDIMHRVSSHRCDADIEASLQVTPSNAQPGEISKSGQSQS